MYEQIDFNLFLSAEKQQEEPKKETDQLKKSYYLCEHK